MVRDFLSSIRHGRPAPIGIDAALEMSVPGLCAHQSALNGGTPRGRSYLLAHEKTRGVGGAPRGIIYGEVLFPWV